MRFSAFFFIGGLFIILLCYSWYTNILVIETSQNYFHKKIDKNVLMDIQKHPEMKNTRDKIFFLESQSVVNHSLNARQACSIESAAYMNPNSTVFVIFLTPTNRSEVIKSNLTDTLLQFKNVHFVHVNLKEFSKKTPLEQWIQTDKLSKSKYVVSHTSDVLRFLLLYKFSGTYLDLDVISKYPLDRINLTNFACAESKEGVNCAILKLTGDSGHKIAENILIELSKSFDGKAWAKNGPQVLTQVIKKMYNITNFNSRISLENFTVLEEDKCYAINWDRWEDFFKPDRLDYVRRRTKDSYFVHFFSHVSNKIPLEKSSKVALIEFAEQYCPKVFNNLDYYF